MEINPKPDLTKITQKRIFNKNQTELFPELVCFAETLHDMTLKEPNSFIFLNTKNILNKLKELEK